MFLMELAHGENFGSPEGSFWTLLLVLVLMLWLQKKRAATGGLNSAAAVDNKDSVALPASKKTLSTAMKRP